MDFLVDQEDDSNPPSVTPFSHHHTESEIKTPQTFIGSHSDASNTNFESARAQNLSQLDFIDDFVSQSP